MLVLTRKARETIIVGDNIVISVVEIQGNRVRIGVQAPGDVSIRRAELAPVLGTEGQPTMVRVDPASKPVQTGRTYGKPRARK